MDVMSSTKQSDRVLQLWAKTDESREGGRYHPLLFHMLDVAAVALLVWERCLPVSFRRRLECSLGTDAHGSIVFLSGAHDIGKASPGFQKTVPALSQKSTLPFSDNDQNYPHGFISARVLKDSLAFPCSTSTLLAQIAGGHHGVFPRSIDLQMGQDKLGNNDWAEIRQELLQAFAVVVGFDLDHVAQSKSAIIDPATVPILAGFISVVDWIGSNQDFFPCIAAVETPIGVGVKKYWKQAQDQALRALEKLGWLPSVIFAKETHFGDIFNGFIPNGIQETVIELASKQTSPYLMIVEAPMGQGKTEAALCVADMAMCRGFARGMYIAMPTQATGNAMFKRVLGDYLKKRGHRGRLNLQLVHGDALLAQMVQVEEGEIPEFNPNSIGDDSDTEAQSWFAAKKRPLLAPFGVGTIDQSLLSVLQTKHWFVRLFGLAGKVVIFDEVHAYDAYMSTILERLLHWLAEVDCTVILLSATLPEDKRRALVRAYSGRDDGDYKRYPRVALVGPRRYEQIDDLPIPICKEIPKEASRTIDLEVAKTDLASLTQILAQRLEHGGCAAVVCNTVNRAIDIYTHLRDSLQETESLLFHARTLQMWRRDREAEVLRKFGKGEKQADGTYMNLHRPLRAVLVATQLIEQSLDLDFDFMISEIAPVDLLLQRCGRLHRHLRPRPEGLEIPKCVVLCDAQANGPPPESFGKSIEFVYDRYILLRTWLALRQCREVGIPSEIENLVEAVYGESALVCSDDWKIALEQAKRGMQHDRNESQKEADRLLVCPPERPDDLIEKFNNQFSDDEDPLVHKSVRAATREGDPSITVVVLPADAVIEENLNVSAVRALLDRSVKLSHKGIFRSLLARGNSPKEWTNNAHLRHARLLRLDERNQGKIDNYMLTVDELLGVVIKKECESNG